jgi:WD repeat-containing protein 90
MLATGQEGQNPIIRIWDLKTRTCICSVGSCVKCLQFLSFSCNGEYLASVGKDSHNREQIIVWNISNISQGQKPKIIAKQLSYFNILCLKFSPIDSDKLCSCGQENIRFWRIKNGHLPGSAVVLNKHSRDTVFSCLDYEFV